MLFADGLSEFRWDFGVGDAELLGDVSSNERLSLRFDVHAVFSRQAGWRIGEEIDEVGVMLRGDMFGRGDVFREVAVAFGEIW